LIGLLDESPGLLGVAQASMNHGQEQPGGYGTLLSDHGLLYCAWQVLLRDPPGVQLSGFERFVVIGKLDHLRQWLDGFLEQAGPVERDAKSFESKGIFRVSIRDGSG
jgi:hypothetical protein